MCGMCMLDSLVCVVALFADVRETSAWQSINIVSRQVMQIRVVSVRTEDELCDIHYVEAQSSHLKKDGSLKAKFNESDSDLVHG